MPILDGNLDITMPARGQAAGTWDTNLNAALTTLASAIADVGTLAITNGSNSPSIDDLDANIIVLTGTLSAPATIAMPAPTAGTDPGISGRRIFVNQTTGGQTITILGSSSDTGQGQVFLLPLMIWQVAVVFDGTTAWYDNYAGTPPGTFMPFGGSTIPAGFLLCFGQSVLRATYPQLFAAIGTAWGSVDGSHFTLPDFRGRVLAGADDMGGSSAGRLPGYTFGHTGGAAGNVVQQSNLASFGMGGSISGSANGTVSGSVNVNAGGGNWETPNGGGTGQNFCPTANLTPWGFSTGASLSVSGSASISSGGSGSPLSVIQPTGAVNVMIRY